MIYKVAFTLFGAECISNGLYNTGDVKITQVKKIPDKYQHILHNMLVLTSRRKIDKGIYSYNRRYQYYVNTNIYEDISGMIIFNVIKPLIREAKINGILN